MTIVGTLQSAGNPVLRCHCGVKSQGPVLVITKGLYHFVSIVGFVRYHGSCAFVSRNDDHVGVILQAVKCLALLKGQVRFWWLVSTTVQGPQTGRDGILVWRSAVRLLSSTCVLQKSVPTVEPVWFALQSGRLSLIIRAVQLSVHWE